MFPKHVDVNTRSIRLAIEEGRRPMGEFFDSRHGQLPFFGNRMTGERFGNVHHESFSMAHIPGRWLNALLNAQDVLHEPADETAVERLANWAYRSMEAVDIGFPACIDLETLEPARKIDLHNLREAMHAFYALVCFRGDERALMLAHKMMDSVDQYFDFDSGRFREDDYRADTGAALLWWPQMQLGERYPIPVTFGRYIGPLVKLYRATGDNRAMEQAVRLKECCFRHVLNEAGDYNVERFGAHTHSTTAMISSIAQLAEVTDDRAALERVMRFMENGANAISVDFGWCIENYFRTDSVGEINNTSDLMETCLILGRAGYGGYYARAERILRAHLLPAQLLDTRFIQQDDNPANVETYCLPKRAKGAFGFPCPYGHEDAPGAEISFNWDIVGGGVSGLCEAYRAQHTLNGRLVSVNLLFDHESPWARFSSPYGRDGLAVLALKQDGFLARVRIPEGAAPHFDPAEAFQDGEWLYLKKTAAGRDVQIRFGMRPERRAVYFREKRFVFSWLAEEVIAAASKGKRLCYFPEIE
jgi:hypothetical protein